MLLCYCSIVLDRPVSLVPRELVTHALISCLGELSVLESRRVVF